MEFKGKKILIVGAGQSGLAAARYCQARGAQIILNDRQSREELAGQIKPFEELGTIFRLGSHSDNHFADVDAVILSPGVPTNLEVFPQLREKGIPILGELELAAQETDIPIIAVTGTNGKSTTVSMIHAMLEASGKKSGLGGNIGTPFLELLSREEDFEIFVIEVSSYQLESIDRFHPHVAVLLNMSADHLGRHQTLAAYMNAKGRIFTNQEPNDWAVYNADDSHVESIIATARAHRLPWSLRRPISPGLYRKGMQVIWFREGHQESYDLSQFQLMGEHQIENAIAAIASARLAGATLKGIQSTLDSFQGLPHRFEKVGSFRGITFINDSKATNVGAAVRATECIPSGHLILLAGGEDKGSSYLPLKEALAHNQAKAICVYGEAAGLLQECFSEILPTFRYTTMDEAFGEAIRLAEDGDTILLAPACASFDQFANFEHRGEAFRQLALQQAGHVEEKTA